MRAFFQKALRPFFVAALVGGLRLIKLRLAHAPAYAAGQGREVRGHDVLAGALRPSEMILLLLLPPTISLNLFRLRKFGGCFVEFAAVFAFHVGYGNTRFTVSQI